MTTDAVETLIQTTTRKKMKILHLKEQKGEAVAFLSYSIDDQNNMTIWHTEVPPALQRMGLGAKLVGDAVRLASQSSSRLRLVCPFAKGYLENHPELSERYSLRLL